MNVNLRSDNTFVEDKEWHTARNRYEDFPRRHNGLNILFLELGVGRQYAGYYQISFLAHDCPK